ncbi:MAG: hypothetical protein F6K41_37090 [Symploca sp. SIO3E6]|nr:hypothetical protein [Caldora sp. SIO3E6]
MGETKSTSHRRTTEVGLAELDTLADIFEGQTPELDETWEKEEIISWDGSQLASDFNYSLDWDDQSDLSDLISDLDGWENSDSTNDFSDLLFEEVSPELLTAEAGLASNLSSLFGDTSEILRDGEDENDELTLDPSSQELDNLSFAESQGDETALRDSESDFRDLLAIATDHQEDLEFGEKLMIDDNASDFDFAELELDESLADFNLTNAQDLDLSQLKSEQEVFAIGEHITTQAVELEENSQALNLEGLFDKSTQAEVDDLASLLVEDMPPQEQELDWQDDLFGSEVPTQTVETPAPTAAEVDDLASLLGEDMSTQEQELDWQDDLFGSEVPTQTVETPAPTAAEVDDLASLLGEDMPPQEQELDWQDDLFGSEVPTQTVETPAPTAAEVDDLASLLDEDMPPQEQELDWQDDLFGSEVPTQTVETPAPTAAEVDDLASLFGENLPPQEQELDWQADLFGSDIPTQTVETPATTAAEVDDLASLLGENLPLQEQELDWQDDLFGSDIPTQTVETPAPTAAEVDDLASLLGEDIPAEESGLLSTEEQGKDNLPEEEITEVLEPEDRQELLQAEANEVTDVQEWEEVSEVKDKEPVVASAFNKLETMLEEEPPLTTASSTTAMFDELETMLEEEPPLTTASSTTAMFDELEAMLEEEPPLTTATSSTRTDIFGDLEMLLDEDTPKIAEPSPEPEKSKAKAEDDDEFGDLEQLLEKADTMGGPPTIKADQRQTKPQSRLRPTRMFDQTMRVQIKRLDDLSNLVGELVVNRNSLEQDQERLRQFLDNLNHQVLSLNDVGARMQDLYERSLLESSLLASRHNYRSFFGGESPSENNQANAEYDPLEMDRFTGFHTLSQEMIELIVRLPFYFSEAKISTIN